MSRNQIIELEDGTFQIGHWVLNAENKAIFMEIDEAGDLPTAIAKADVYDDEDFKQAKHEIDFIGGIEGANRILKKMKEQNAVAILHTKNVFDESQLEYLNQAAFEKYLNDVSENSGETDQHFHGKWEIENNLKTIRFVTF